MVHVLQNGHGGEEVLVLLPLALGGVLNDVVEGLSIEGPERCIGVGHNGGSSRSIVEKGQLTKDVRLARIGRGVVLEDLLLLAIDELSNA